MAVSKCFPEQNEDSRRGGSGGSVLGSGGGGATGGAATAPAAQGTGTGFTNLQKFLDVNQDTGSLAGAVSEQAGSGIGAFGQDLQSTAQGIASGLGQQQANFESNTLVGGQPIPESFRNAEGGLASQFKLQPVDTSALSSQGNVGRTRINAIQDLALNDRATQRGFLLDTFGDQGLTRGGSKLDALILGQTNRQGLEQGLQANRQRVNQEIATAGAIPQAARLSRYAAADTFLGGFNQSIAAEEKRKTDAIAATQKAEQDKIDKAAADQAAATADIPDPTDSPFLGGPGGFTGTRPDADRRADIPDPTQSPFFGTGGFSGDPLEKFKRFGRSGRFF